MAPQPIQTYNFFQELCKLPFVESIYLFGSRARGDYDARSDIDLALICPTATKNDWLKVTEIISKADTLLKIDCIRLDTLQDQELKEEIEKYHTVLYEKDKHEG